MRTLIIGLLVAILLIPSPILAWGPRTHTEIAHQLEQTSNDFLAGSVLPDYSLSLRALGDDYPNLQSITHSQEFIDLLPEGDFKNGWIAHVESDKIESDYSRLKLGEGAPMGADYPVDQAYHVDPPYITSSHGAIVEDVLDKLGVDRPETDWQRVNSTYRVYIRCYRMDKYKKVLNEWYPDYQEYVDKSVQASADRLELNEEGEEHEGRVAHHKKRRCWCNAIVPEGRAEAERQKRELWREYRQRMSEAETVQEKLSLYEEWKAIRESLSVPTVCSYG